SRTTPTGRGRRRPAPAEPGPWTAARRRPTGRSQLAVAPSVGEGDRPGESGRVLTRLEPALDLRPHGRRDGYVGRQLPDHVVGGGLRLLRLALAGPRGPGRRLGG